MVKTLQGTLNRGVNFTIRNINASSKLEYPDNTVNIHLVMPEIASHFG